MNLQRPRRFWKHAVAVPCEGGHGIVLDDRPIKAPSKRDLRCATAALAQAVAEEWNAQDELLRPETMPLTQFANTACDRVPQARGTIIAEMLRHVDTDVLCYRADQPETLVARQRAAWEPVLAWADERFGVVWTVGSGVMPVSQEPAVHAALGQAMAALDHESLTALQVAAPLCASLVLGFALVEGRLTAEQAFTAAFVDELYQAEAWGEDAEAAARRDGLRRDLDDVERFLALARQE